MLSGAAEDAGCELHLALLSIEETGSADHTGSYGSRWRDDHEETFEVAEVSDRTEILSDWRRPDDTPGDLGPLPLGSDSLVPPDALDDMAPDDQSFHEATGNEGASFERSYRRAAFVLWPKVDRLAVIAEGGLPATLPLLAALADRSGEDPSARNQAHELVGRMIAAWPPSRYDRARNTPALATVLDTLRRLGDLTRIDDVIAQVTAAGHYAVGQAEHVLPALALLPRERGMALCSAIVAETATEAFEAAADFLAAASEAAAAGRLPLSPADLGSAARALLSGLPGDPARRPDTPAWGAPRRVAATTLTKAMTALARIESGTADTAAARVLDRPAAFDLDEVLVPALLALGGSDVSDTSAVRHLRDAGLAHLRRRIALPLAPPADWSRDAKLSCKCPHCSDLGRFLADPARETWMLKAVEHERGHVESIVETSGSDLDCTTSRKGRPYTLICTKNRASYDLRSAQRARDLHYLATLETAARDAEP